MKSKKNKDQSSKNGAGKSKVTLKDLSKLKKEKGGLLAAYRNYDESGSEKTYREEWSMKKKSDVKKSKVSRKLTLKNLNELKKTKGGFLATRTDSENDNTGQKSYQETP